MTIFFLALLGIIAACSVAFGIGLYSASLADRVIWLKIFSAVLVGLLFVAGSMLVYSEVLLAKAQAKESAAVQTELADARAKQDKAERELKVVRNRQGLRTVSDEFREALKGKSAGAVVIVYVGGNSELIMFAEQLWRTLNDAGWDVPRPTQVQSVLDVMPFNRASSDLTVFCPLPKGSRAIPAHAQVLFDALAKQFQPITLMSSAGHELPDNRPRLIINPRF
jgi:hypothetical protein